MGASEANYFLFYFSLMSLQLQCPAFSLVSWFTASSVFYPSYLKSLEKKKGVAYKGSLWLGMGKGKYFFFQQHPPNLFLCLALLVLVMGSIMLR
jgi:hypothetical protein